MLDVVGYVKGVGRVLLISSALPKEGKTLLSVSLAGAAAMSGRRSIIVDFDLRKPAVASMLHLEAGSPDLLDCLTASGVLDGDMVNAAIRAHPTLDKLSILAPGSLAADAGLILASDRVGDLVRILRKRYDFVILNAPPILPVRDAKHLARLSDVCLLVARWGRTDSDALRSANELLGRGVTGVVINRVNLKRHADSRYGDSIQHYEAYAGYFGKSR
jgi:capsular exopolysaccharide synthesis family protein